MTNWLDDEEQLAWRAFLRGNAMILDAINKDMIADNDLTLNEYEVLVRLSETPERKERMSVLADNLVHSRSRLTHTVKRLEKLGYVDRISCPHDRRGIICVLTARGLAKLEESAPLHVESVRRHLVDNLYREEFLDFGRIWAKIEAKAARQH